MGHLKDNKNKDMLDPQINKEHPNRDIIDERPVYLYNVVEDPYENNNIAKENQEIVEKMKMRLEEYQSSMIPPHTAFDTKQGNPSNFGGVWSPGWCESE